MTWIKTEAGRQEMQSRAQVKERARRNLLLLIDGVRSERELLATVDGVAPTDFQALHALGLIMRPEAAATSPAGPTSPAPAAQPGSHPESPASPGPAVDAVARRALTDALTQLIPAHLGLRGLTLTLAVERAQSPEELQEVAHRVIEAVKKRKGNATAVEVQRALFGA
jgi:hypothetical protein